MRIVTVGLVCAFGALAACVPPPGQQQSSTPKQSPEERATAAEYNAALTRVRALMTHCVQTGQPLRPAAGHLDLIATVAVDANGAVTTSTLKRTDSKEIPDNVDSCVTNGLKKEAFSHPGNKNRSLDFDLRLY